VITQAFRFRPIDTFSLTAGVDFMSRKCNGMNSNFILKGKGLAIFGSNIFAALRDLSFWHHTSKAH
jgi:hypothetical protein